MYCEVLMMNEYYSKGHNEIGLNTQTQNRLVGDMGQIKNDLATIIGQYDDINLLWSSLMQGKNIDGLSIYRVATPHIASQYHQLMIDNNARLTNNTVMVKSIEEIMNSQDTIIVVYHDVLIGAIRLQKQHGPEGSDVSLYQRASLLVRPGFRTKDIDGFALADLLVVTINRVHTDKPIYGITKTIDVVRKNEAAGNVYMTVAELSFHYPEFYQYVVDSRGGNDFKDVHDDENPQDHYFIYNATMKQWLDHFYCQKEDVTECVL